MSKINLKRKFLGFALAAVASASCGKSAVADLYVTQVGDGTTTLNSASFPVSIKQFANNGSQMASINLPTAIDGSNHPLTLSGSATTEGFISLSSNGEYLTIGGYGVVPATPSVPQTTAPRVVGRIAIGSNAIDTTTALTDAYIGASGDNGNIRSVVSTDGTKFWLSGTAFPNTSAGVRYATLGSTTSTAITTAPLPTNVRVVNIFDGQLYGSTMTGAFRGVNEIGTDLPEVSVGSVTLLSGFDPATNSPESAYDFWFKDANTLYVADDRSAANGGGIQKWEQNGGVWALTYTLGVGTGARGLAGQVEDGVTTLYATTTQTSANNLVSIIDSGVGATFNIMATAPANTVFRGVEFVNSSVTPPANNADFNNDNVVDGADFLIWQRGFGLSGQPNKSTGDATGDGNVNGLDLDQWKLKFGGAPAIAAVSAIPEPATALLGSLAAVGLFATARRRR
jgi:hypothetical protein